LEGNYDDVFKMALEDNTGGAEEIHDKQQA
jgi:hypothetical protein